MRFTRTFDKIYFFQDKDEDGVVSIHDYLILFELYKIKYCL